MSNASRKSRGLRTQLVVASWFKDRGWPYAESAGSGRPGVDVLGLPGLACEVKARRSLDITGWLRQAAKEERQGMPFVVFRPDGFGEASVGTWGVLMDLQRFTELLKEAGYGSEL